LDPSLDLYLVYWLERIMAVSVSDLWTKAKKISNEAQGMLHTAEARVEGALAEIEGKIINPLIHAAEQPISGLSHSLGSTAHWIRMATYVGGGWLLYSAYQGFFDPQLSKRNLESFIDNRVRTSNKRRRY
jgi:hypothetical protein